MKTDTIHPDLTKAGKSLIAVLNQEDLLLFDFLKNAMLEIFPLRDTDDKGNSVKPYFDEMSLELAECFAFKATTGISEYIKSQN